ncbi:MAG: twin-arginine translocase TatA/TatE family subunit [Nitrososphaerales archaeon]
MGPLFIAGMEWILVLVAAGGMLLFGAKKIPQIARSFGRAQSDFEKGKLEGKKDIDKMVNSDDRVKLLKIAETVGIETEGLSDEQLKQAITEALSKK